MPMTAGSTPTALNPRQMARMGSPRRTASRRVISRLAAAPSDTCRASHDAPIWLPARFPQVGAMARMLILD